MALAKRMETQFVGDLSCRHGVGEILLVGKHKQHSVAELILVEHAVEFISSLGDTIAIVAIHHEDQTLGVLEIVAPKRTDLQQGGNGRMRITLKCNGVTDDREIGRGESGDKSVCRTLSCPPTSHTVKEMFLYSTVSTLNPAGRMR